MPDYHLVCRLAAAISLMRETHDHHGERVATFARSLAAAAGLEPDQVELVGVGAQLHDIGKILVRRDVLNAPRKLTPIEQVEMRRHTELGWALVHQSGFDTLICEMVRHHHERYDGNGYPDRLANQQIPLAARIVAVCDSYEAMTSPRTYRQPFSPAFTQTYLQSDRGAFFDPRLVELFLHKVVG